MLFNLRCEPDINAVRQEHAWMCDSKYFGNLVASGGNVDQIHLSVKLFCNCHTFVDVISAFIAHRPANTDVNRESAAAFLFDAFDYSYRKPAAVLQAAAPLILAIINFRVKKLVQEPSVPGMDSRHSKSAELGKSGCVCKSFDGFLYNFFGHSRDKFSERVKPFYGSVDLVAFSCRAVGVRTGMLQFNRCNCSMAIYCGRQTVDRWNRRSII